MNDTAEGLTTSELSNFMSEKGYEWSNEAQIYYHRSYQLPVYDSSQAEKLYSIQTNKATVMFVLIEEIIGGGSLLCAADIDKETLVKEQKELEKMPNDSVYRIAEIELTNKRRLVSIT